VSLQLFELIIISSIFLMVYAFFTSATAYKWVDFNKTLHDAWVEQKQVTFTW